MPELLYLNVLGRHYKHDKHNNESQFETMSKMSSCAASQKQEALCCHTISDQDVL